MESLTQSILIALIIGLVEIVKRLGVPSRFLPLFAVGFGLIFNFLDLLVGMNIAEVIINGIICGLSACGLWSGTKAVMGK